MNKNILSEVNRNRELMGINESELDEQGFLRGVRDGIKKGYNDAKDFIKDKIGDPVKDAKDSLEKYNGKPVEDIIQEIYESGKRNGKIDVNGETLYYGVGLSSSIEISRSKAESNARIAMADDLGEKTQSDNITTTTQTQKGVSTVIDKLFQTSNGKYNSYILIKPIQSNVN
jgi:hypothetical protein